MSVQMNHGSCLKVADAKMQKASYEYDRPGDDLNSYWPLYPVKHYCVNHISLSAKQSKVSARSYKGKLSIWDFQKTESYKNKKLIQID